MIPPVKNIQCLLENWLYSNEKTLIGLKMYGLDQGCQICVDTASSRDVLQFVSLC